MAQLEMQDSTTLDRSVHSEARSHVRSNVHDLVIVGAGPAGLSASIYASRALLDFVTIEQTSPGGQILLTSEIDNYPGVPSAAGFDLVDAMAGQARELGATIVSDQVESITQESNGTYTVACAQTTYQAQAVILATGATPRKAGFEGEQMFFGRGVSYCGTCDGMFYRDKHVFVVGGGNTAAEEALFLTRFASKVTMLVRKDVLRAQAVLARELEANPKVEIRYHTSLVALEGHTLPSSLVLRDNNTQTLHTETFDEGGFGVFVFVGHDPAAELVSNLVDVSSTGAVLTDDAMATRTPGLYCAGDVREKPLRQVVTAVSDGAIAATSVVSYLKTR